MDDRARMRSVPDAARIQATPGAIPRRDFLIAAGVGAGGFLALPSCAAEAPAPTGAPGAQRIRWKREGGSRLFSEVSWEGAPLAIGEPPSLLDGVCRLGGEAPGAAMILDARKPAGIHGPLRAELTHRLLDSGRGLGEDVLEATLSVTNASARPQIAELAFATTVQPSPRVETQRAYLPLSAAGGAGDGRFAELGVKGFLVDCDHAVGAGELRAHYLEPKASDPGEVETRALLLAPVVDVSHPRSAVRVGLFTSSPEPRRFGTFGSGGWRVGRCVAIEPGASVAERCWLFLHEGDAAVTWKAFHRFAHREDDPPIAWTREFKVHRYDFLSAESGEGGRRGGGYEADIHHFHEFRVGMATQHGYYPWLGDYIQPDRTSWLAMRGDRASAVEMSFEKMRERIRATRAAGARAAVYLHPVLFDDAGPLFAKMRDSVLVDAAGKPVPFPWEGPDTAGKNWRASLASREWREHLLEQARWILEILDPRCTAADGTDGISVELESSEVAPAAARLRYVLKGAGAMASIRGEWRIDARLEPQGTALRMDEELRLDGQSTADLRVTARYRVAGERAAAQSGWAAQPLKGLGIEMRSPIPYSIQNAYSLAFLN